jgi:beta-glucosidase
MWRMSTATGPLAFPDGFTWGTATAAYQIEGGVGEDGRGTSIWDTFCRVDGNVRNGDTGDVACDHYHRVEDDLDLMASLGLPAYRFSIAWPRVIPDGSGAVNPEGVAFYDRLVDGLLARGISPLATLYHWDLPQACQDAGGWAARDTAAQFAEYAGVVAEALGDRLPVITTLNEPWCSAFLGYASGVHAPGVRDNATALAAAHHLNLAHGLAAQAIRTTTSGRTGVSLTLNLAQVYPLTDGPVDRSAAEHADRMANRIFLDPVLRGYYPDALLDETRHITDWSFVHDEDLAEIHGPLDMLGVNFYTPSTVGAPPPEGDEASTATGRWTSDPGARELPVPWPGTDRACSYPQPGPYTDMGWRILPQAFTDLLVRVHRDYPEVPVTVTENGCAYPDGPDEDGRVRDDRRIEYLRSHLAAVLAAIQAGVDVRGYYLWSLLDNFEWALGYSKRFGIVHVDYDTLVRTPKDSAQWYADVVAANALPS